MDLHTAFDFALRALMICLCQMNSHYWSPYSLFPTAALTDTYRTYVTTDLRAAATLLEWPKVVQLQPMCSEGAVASGSLATGGPELGHTAPMWQEDVVMMSPLTGVVQKPHPQNSGGTWLKITSNRFPLVCVIGPQNIHVYCFKIGWRLIWDSHVIRFKC